jgi:hypothetical protein
VKWNTAFTASKNSLGVSHSSDALENIPRFSFGDPVFLSVSDAPPRCSEYSRAVIYSLSSPVSPVSRQRRRKSPRT